MKLASSYRENGGGANNDRISKQKQGQISTLNKNACVTLPQPQITPMALTLNFWETETIK